MVKQPNAELYFYRSLSKTVKHYTAIIILILCMSGDDVYAQFSDSVHHYISCASTGSINSTNDGVSYLLNNNLKYGLRRKDISLNESNSWVYGANPDKLTNNDFIATLDFNLYKTFKHFFYWGLGNYTTSYSLRIDQQVQGGLGAAYNIIDHQNAVVNISDGFLYERSNIFVNDTTKTEYHTFRNSLRLRFRWKTKHAVMLTGSAYYQPSLNFHDDYIINANVTAAVKVFRFISITTAFNYSNVSRTKRENMLFTYGLTFDRSF